MAKQEYEGVAFTAMIKTETGQVINFTARLGSTLDAFEDVEATVALKEKEGWVPFVTQYNKANDQPTVAPAPLLVTPLEDAPGVVAQAVEMGGEIIHPAPIDNFPDDIPEGATRIPDDTLYLGLKDSKLDAIGENQSYEVYANCYSYDGKGFVNFFNGTKPAAGHYYATEYGQKLFKDMFPLFVPVVGSDHSPLPRGPVKLYVVGVMNKGKVYQNIKGAEDA